MLLLIMFLAMVAMILINVPIAFALAISAVIGVAAGGLDNLISVAIEMYRGATSFCAHCHPDVRAGWRHHECRRNFASADRDGVRAHRICPGRACDGQCRRFADLRRNIGKRRCRRRRARVRHDSRR